MKSSKPEFNIDAIVNNPVTKQQLLAFVEELGLAQSEIDKAKNAMKDITEEAKTSLGIPGKVLNKLLREKLDPGALEGEIHELDEVQAVAEVLGYVTPDSTAP